MHPITAAKHSFTHASDFLAYAADLLTRGAPADSPEVAMYVDFAQRKTWQGQQELAGDVFDFQVE